MVVIGMEIDKQKAPENGNLTMDQMIFQTGLVLEINEEQLLEEIRKEFILAQALKPRILL